jgi:hypothetical protein
VVVVEYIEMVAVLDVEVGVGVCIVLVLRIVFLRRFIYF